MSEKAERKQLDPWDVIARYKKSITDATNEVLKIIPAFAVQPVLGNVNDELKAYINEAMAQKTASMEGEGDV